MNRKKNSKKGDNGKVLIIGGSIDYIGAPYLAGLACLRTGADIVTIAAPIKVAWAINCLCPDLITIKLPGRLLTIKHYDEIAEKIKNFDVVLIGPGLGLAKETKDLVKKICSTNKKKVIDADALKAVDLNSVSNSVLTPHAKEYEILMKSNPNIGSNIILLKGPVDKIISKQKKQSIKGGNAGMTVGGSGDVLAGICAGLLAQKMTLWNSSILASKINKSIGSDLKDELGNGYIASDFLRLISKKTKKFI